MINLLKADLLKFRWSKLNIKLAINVAIMFLIYISAGEVGFVDSGNERFGQGVGFISQSFREPGIYRFEQVARTAMSYTVFFWVIVLVICTIFFMKEYEENTVKLAIAYGYSRFKIYLSKLLIMSGFIGILYYLFIGAIFTHATYAAGITLEPRHILTMFLLTTLNFMVLAIFILLSLLVCLLLKNPGVINTVITVFIFAGATYYMMIYDQVENLALHMKGFIKVNPMYYWMTICAYNFDNNIIQETIIYFIVGAAVLLGASYQIVKKQEIK